MKKTYQFIPLFILVALCKLNIGFSDQRTSISDNTEYLNASYKAVKNLENFKKDPSYIKILEHLTFEDGIRLLDLIQKKYPEILNEIDLFKINDKLGGGKVYEYPNIGMISPSTLRYVKVAAELKKFFGSLDNKEILEIGGGYGGQALILSQLFQVSSYQLIDLKAPLELQSAYLDAFNIKNKVIQVDQLDEVEGFDLFISNYAFSECTKSVQKMYLSKVISKAKCGYVICNQISQLNGIESYSQKELIKNLENLGFEVSIYAEEPQTFSGNYLLIFTK